MRITFRTGRKLVIQCVNCKKLIKKKCYQPSQQALNMQYVSIFEQFIDLQISLNSFFLLFQDMLQDGLNQMSLQEKDAGIRTEGNKKLHTKYRLQAK